MFIVSIFMPLLLRQISKCYCQVVCISSARESDGKNWSNRQHLQLLHGLQHFQHVRLNELRPVRVPGRQILLQNSEKIFLQFIFFFSLLLLVLLPAATLLTSFLAS
jgi:hypothetical protein